MTPSLENSGAVETSSKAPSLDDGGVVEEGGMARVDTNEVFLGMNTRETIGSLAESSRRQVVALEQLTDKLVRSQEHTNRLLQALLGKDMSMVVNEQVLAKTAANAIVQQYGNVLNPGSLIS
jgi:hypothetical protein